MTDCERDSAAPCSRDEVQCSCRRLIWERICDHVLVQRDLRRDVASFPDSGRFITVRGQRFFLRNPTRSGHFEVTRIPAWYEYFRHPFLTVRRCLDWEEASEWRFKRVSRPVEVALGEVKDADIVIIQGAQTGRSLRGTGFALALLRAVLREGHLDCYVQGEAPNEIALKWHRHLNHVLRSRMLYFPEYETRGPSRRVEPGSPLDAAELAD